VIRKLPAGDYRLYSRRRDRKTGKRRNLVAFRTRAAAEQHERHPVLQAHGLALHRALSTSLTSKRTVGVSEVTRQ
jgi:hypothetical protein